MDSPLASPKVARTKDSEDDEGDASSLLLFQQWAHSIKPLYRAVSVVILGMVLSALVFSSLPLWRPMAVVMLHKLWDILRFFVITTSIGLGIINSKLWRGNYTDRDAIASNSGKEDSISSKVPFAGMFYSDFQPSYSFNEQEVGEYSSVSRSGSANGREYSANTMPFSAVTTSTADGNDEFTKSENISNLQVSDTITQVPEIKVGSGQESNVNVGGVVEEPLSILAAANNPMKEVPTVVKRRLRKPCDDMDLATVVENDQSMHSSKIKHRRGKSLEFPADQEGGMPRYGDIDSAAADHRRRGVLASGEKSSSARKTPSSDFTVKDEMDEPFSRKTNMNVASATASTSTSAPMMSTSKHNRSRSAYDLKELLVDEREPRSKPRSKPGTTSSQLARRRNVSLSCDLDKDCTDRAGVPAWLASLPSPPAPPLIDGYNGTDANRGVREEIHADGKQDESSLRKAYSESLAPWRAATSAFPVDIPKKEAVKETKRKPKTQERKKSPVKEEKGVGTPPSSPSTPTSSFMGSPSPGELNKKVDAFIARFHERMRLQRLESLKRSRQRPH